MKERMRWPDERIEDRFSVLTEIVVRNDERLDLLEDAVNELKVIQERSEKRNAELFSMKLMVGSVLLVQLLQLIHIHGT